MTPPDAPRYVVAEHEHLRRIEQVIRDTLGGHVPGQLEEPRASPLAVVQRAAFTLLMLAAALWLFAHL